MNRTLVMPARPFAAAWLNAYLCAGDDDSQPALYRTVTVEVHEDGLLQLVSTDSYMLVRTAVSDDGESVAHVDLAARPSESIVAMDPDGRAKALLAYVYRSTKDRPDATVRLHVRSGEDPDRPTLAPILDRRQLIIETDDERVTLGIFDGPAPEWRTLLEQHTPAPVERVGLNPDLLARFAKFKTSDGTAAVEFIPAGPLGALRWRIQTLDAVIDGALMPVRGGVEA